MQDPTDEGHQRLITLHAPEAPEIYFEDYGETQLVDGFAHVDLDLRFAANVRVDATHPLRVFLQPYDDETSPGLIVKNRTATGFDVVERQGGRSNMAFGWHVICNREDEIFGQHKSKNADARFETRSRAIPTSK